MEVFGLLLAAYGLVLLAWRMWPRSPRPGLAAELAARKSWPMVSVVVPARNEEAVLGRLLVSLKNLDYPSYEVIVVDDCSEDRTAAIVEASPFTLVRGKPRPDASWKGKPWACQQGAAVARGDYLLFTDADTIHRPDGLKRAIVGIEAEEAEAASTLPFHACETLWERLCGPFHVTLLAGTAPYGKGRRGQVFAIGQYLLFQREVYWALGAHESIKTEIAEDIAFANRMLEQKRPWAVLRGAPYFEVRMYASLIEFVRGWRRSFRAGMERSVPWAPLEMMAFLAAQTAALHVAWPAGLILMAICWLVLARVQRSLGQFSVLGIICLPFALGLFCLASVLATYDRILKRPTLWKNRSYAEIG